MKRWAAATRSGRPSGGRVAGRSGGRSGGRVGGASIGRVAGRGRYLWQRVAIFAIVGTAGSFLFVAAALSSAWYPSGQQAPDLSTPKGLYDAGCRYCHADDGRGVDLSTVAFDTPLPDFTDCSFATREPDADWFIVTHQGGPIRGFDHSMPAYNEAYSDEQINMVVDYLRTFCADDRWPRGELNYPRPIVTEKAYPEDELVFTMGANVDGPGGVAGAFQYEKRFLAAGQFEVFVPIGALQLETDGAWLGGIGDIEVGYKHVLAQSLDRGMIFSGNLAVKLPTGDVDKGLGTGTFVFEPFVSAGFGLPRNSFVHVQTGVELPTNTEKADREFFWRGVVGTTFTAGRFGRAFSPMVEILGVTEFEDEQTVNNLDVLPQVQFTLNTRQHIMANFGVRFPVNNTEGRSTQLIFYLLWEWFDGGFFDGW